MTFLLQEARHPYFERRGADVVWRRQISREQAAKDIVVKVPALDGTEVREWGWGLQSGLEEPG